MIRPLTYEDFDIEQAANETQDGDYVRAAVERILRSVAPEYEIPTPLNFDIAKHADGLAVATNIDFVRLNESYHRRVSPAHSTLTPAMILTQLQDVREELYFASLFGADLAATGYRRPLLELKIAAVLAASQRAELQRGKLIGLVLENSFAIREAVNSKRIQWADLRRLYEKARKFRHWLNKQNPDVDLLRAYYEEVVRSTWVEKLPGKSTRWAVLTGMGIIADAAVTGGIGTAIGVGLSAIDAFWLDRVLKGWKPNQFVEEELKPVLNKDVRKR